MTGFGSSLMRRAAACGVALAVACSLAGCENKQQSELSAKVTELSQQLAQTQTRLQTLEDVKAIEKLTRTYGYYIDKGMWSEVVDLFAEDSAVQLGASGIFRGKKGADRMFAQGFGARIGRGAGTSGLPHGVLFNHPQFQGVVDVDPGNTTAKGRWRTLAQVAWQGKIAFWNEGVYENEYVKEDGVWKFKLLKFWPTYFTEFDKGWAKQGVAEIGRSANSADPQYAPDEPSPAQDSKSMYPDYFMPPFHYPNPVSGKEVKAPAQAAPKS
ncbi:MAG TPA: nuclear transport factor 2 family protein [Povalibacter sp.]|nr:nuclear transport factor 2 family protein [Povalibacter sp.]